MTTASLNPNPKPRRLGLIIPWAIFAALVIAWTAYWFVLSNIAQNRFHAAVEAERARGAELSFARVETKGFPLQMALELTDAAYAPADRAFRLATPRLVAHVNVLNPFHLIVALPAPVDVIRSDATSRVSGSPFLMSIRTNAQGDLQRASLEANGLRIDDRGKEGDGLFIASALIHIRPDERTPGAYQVAMTFDQATLPEPVRSFEALGRSIEHLSAAIVITEGAALASAPRGDALLPWARAGGEARLETLELNWGAAHGSGRGALSVDAARRPQGELLLRLDNTGDTLRALSEQPSVSNDVRAALAVAAIVYSTSGDALELPLSAHDGGLFIGPSRLRDLPPLYD